ncbi:hypothetical protein ACFLTI_03750 [Bacteroidota bacterium]
MELKSHIKQKEKTQEKLLLFFRVVVIHWWQFICFKKEAMDWGWAEKKMVGINGSIYSLTG